MVVPVALCPKVIKPERAAGYSPVFEAVVKDELNHTSTCFGCVHRHSFTFTGTFLTLVYSDYALVKY
jgi:hypothetical protein